MIGNKNLPVGSTRLVHVDYDDWLDERRNEILTSVTVAVIPVQNAALTVPPTTNATTGPLTFNADKEGVFFLVQGGTVGDVFNIQITATTSLGQVRVDLIGVTVTTVT